MPNWCHNKLTVVGDPELVAAFVENVKGADEDDAPEQPLSFEKIDPTPVELLDTNRAGGALPGWYRWRLVHWGTKWDASFGAPLVALGSGVVPETRTPIVEPGKAFYAFETAWAPPLHVIETASRQHPGLRLTLVWGEPGSDIAGRHVFEDGEEIEAEGLDVDEALIAEEMWF